MIDKDRAVEVAKASAFEQIEGTHGWQVVLEQMNEIKKEVFTKFCKMPVADLTGKKGMDLRAQVKACDEILARLDLLKRNKQAALRREPGHSN